MLVEGVIGAGEFAGRCGRRGDAILLAIERGGHAWVVAVDATTHAVRWRTDLGAGSFALPGMDLQRRRSPDVTVVGHGETSRAARRGGRRG